LHHTATARHAGPTEGEVVRANAQRISAAVAGQIGDGEGVAFRNSKNEQGKK